MPYKDKDIAKIKRKEHDKKYKEKNKSKIKVYMKEYRAKQYLDEEKRRKLLEYNKQFVRSDLKIMERKIRNHKRVTNLEDLYIIRLLVDNSDLPIEVVKENKDIIEIHRLKLKTQRALKQFKIKT